MVKKYRVARLCCSPRLVSLSLFLSLSLLPHRLGWSHVSPLSLADAVLPEGTPWILPRLDPGTLGFQILS